MIETDFMTQALAEARAAKARGEVPVGAVLVEAASGAVWARAGNRVEELFDPTAHAEVLVIREATVARRDLRLPQCDLYVTLEPCALCATGIAYARLRKLVFGAYDPKGGGVDHGPRIFDQPTIHHAPEVIGGVMETECAAILKVFFAQRR